MDQDAPSSTTETVQQTPAAPGALYANAFQVICTNADIALMLQLNGQVLASVNLSFTTAKTLGQMLTEVIEKLESSSNRQIMTTQELDAAIGALRSKKMNPSK